MRCTRWMPALVACVLVLALPPLAASAPAGQREEPGCLRVGVFDSRAVAIVHLRSPAGREPMVDLKRRHAEAEKAGDRALMAELEAAGVAMQDRWHRLGFGTASVRHILRRIEDRLPDLARRAGVDLIVSRWDIVVQEPGIELVDVTEILVGAYEPDDEIQEILAGLAAQPPLTDAELDDLDPNE
jgi:hypothetical protein